MKLITAFVLSMFAGMVLANGIPNLAEQIAEHGSFGEYVKSILRSPEMTQFMVLWTVGSLGVCTNWFWKWLTDQITGSLWQYLAHDHPKRTIASFCCIFTWALWAVNADLTWTAVINLAVTTGFAIDILVNKATPKTS